MMGLRDASVESEAGCMRCRHRAPRPVSRVRGTAQARPARPLTHSVLVSCGHNKDKIGVLRAAGLLCLFLVL